MAKKTKSNNKAYEIKLAGETVASNKAGHTGILAKIQHVSPKKLPKDKLVKPGKLINRNNYPEYVKYEGKGEIRLSPRQKSKIANMDLVGELPKGVVLVATKK